MYRRPPPLRKKSGKRFLFDGRGRLYTGYFSYSFGIETINTFIRSRSSLENHTRYQTKTIPVFRPKLSDSNRARGEGGPGPPHILEKKKRKKKKRNTNFQIKGIFDRIRIFDRQASPKHPNLWLVRFDPISHGDPQYDYLYTDSGAPTDCFNFESLRKAKNFWITVPCFHFLISRYYRAW